MYVCMYACMHACMQCMYVCMYVVIYIYMCVCVCIYIYVCIYICAYMSIYGWSYISEYALAAMSTCMCMHRYACPFSHKDMCTLAKLSEVVVPSLHDLPVLLLRRRDCDHRLHHGADWFNCDPLEPDTGPGGFAEIAQHSSCEPELT